MKTKNYERFSSEIKRHVLADAVIQGEYWKPGDNEAGGRGCFIGCLSHGDMAEPLESEYGVPTALVRLCEGIFEALPADEAKKFFSDMDGAVGRDGKDLTRVVWAFLASELKQLPVISETTKAVIDGMILLSKGLEWPSAAEAATAAAYAAADAAAVADAYYADAAAAYAAYAADAAAPYAAYAADAAAGAAADAAWYVAAATRSWYAYADARKDARARQAKTLLQLITDA
tara:strand:+ start:565 stop:1257 length:693 start_codon:yes stop_codon:yes gene_type:complete